MSNSESAIPDGTGHPEQRKLTRKGCVTSKGVESYLQEIDGLEECDDIATAPDGRSKTHMPCPLRHLR